MHKNGCQSNEYNKYKLWLEFDMNNSSEYLCTAQSRCVIGDAGITWSSSVTFLIDRKTGHILNCFYLENK